ncbi:MAG: carboxypeptidase-like regulatory domain-containing protein, partial [Candidatus Hydrogenedentes bacterium]|nr:carboxypeptidase-like regulatory domain-containing protein [Candidatus Hydrogenedentota bacterium]
GRLSQHRMTMPSSRSDGSFLVANLPNGTEVQLKFSDSKGQYAQATVHGLRVGQRDARVMLYPGILVAGNVFSLTSDIAVVNATIVATRTDPQETILTQADANGAFMLRMQPDTYVFQVRGDSFRSPSAVKKTITGDKLTETIHLTVAGTGMLRGKVLDAATEEPVEGARINLEVGGNPAGSARTGPTGEYELSAAGGENAVRLVEAPGYTLHESRPLSFQVAEGTRTKVPTYWLMPLPTYDLLLVDGDERPVPGAIVNLLQPKQFGWRVADREGRVRLSFAAAPQGGIVVGTAEHPTTRLGALFAITEAQSSDAVRPLLPLGRVEGRVTSDKGKALEGAVVDGRFEHTALAKDIVLWRTLSNEDGGFAWAGAFPLVENQYCTAQSQEDGVVQGPLGKSSSFYIDSLAIENVGNLVVRGGKRSRSAVGDRLRWYDARLQCGVLDDKRKLRETPALVMYCSAGEAAMVVEALSGAKRALAGYGLAFAVVVNGAVECAESAIPILKGNSPSAASTILVGRNGRIAFECFGMPPIHAINALLGR